ncbi:MAG: hypothetical protein ACRCZI_07490 [Cetobacterium sp.]
MNIISFDTATKSLAISFIKYNINYKQELNDLYKEYKSKKFNTKNSKSVDELLLIIDNYNKLLQNAINVLDSRIIIKHLIVVDLIPDKKIAETDAIYRTQKLHEFMHTEFDSMLRKYVNDEHMQFLLEYQMGPNIKSNAISTQLIYHLMKYSKDNNYKGIELVGPSLKNKVYIGDNQHSNFIEKYKTNYAANKNHTKTNFLALIDILKKNATRNNNIEDINIENIKKKNIDDIADSVFMSLAFIFKKYTDFRF